MLDGRWQMVDGKWYMVMMTEQAQEPQDTKLARTTFHTERSIDSSLVGRTK